MGGHHNVEFPPIPDFRKYHVEDVPELLEVQRRLAQRGLRDPWLRNEVWRYQQMPRSTYITFLGPPLFNGFKYGVVIALVATVISKVCARKGEH